MRRIPSLLPVVALTLFVGATAAFAAKSTTTTTAAAPPDYPTALAARLGKEWKDPALANEIVAGLSPDTLASFEAKVPLAQVATSPFLAYRPKPIPAKSVDGLIVYSFGNRVDANGAVTAGPTNEALATTVRAFVKQHPVPVYAQHEVAQFLTGVPNVTSIDEVVGPDGKVVYLSTAGVVDQAKQKGAHGTVGVVCFADHAGRCLLTTEKAGLTAGLVKGITLPSTYDPQSGQPWTHDRKSYLQTDLLGRLATL
jgi:hypothetical protein